MSAGLVEQVITTTVVQERVAPTMSPLPGTSGVYTQINVVSTATQVVTTTILVSPESSTATPSVRTITSTIVSTPSYAPTSSASSSSVSSTSASSISSALPTGARTAASEQSSTATPAPSKSLPAGAIAGIVIGLVLLLNVIGVLLYRRRALAKRRARRATYRAGIKALALPAALDVEKAAGTHVPPAHTSPFMLGMPGAKPAGAGHRRANSDGSPESQYSLPSALTRSPQPAVARDGVAGRARSASPTRRPSGGRAAPERPPRAATRKAAPEITSGPESAGPRTALATPAAAQVPTAVVRVTFIPTRPDELSIAIGQTLAVLHAFDDGWALCQNAYGEQGMAPLECLEGGGGLFRGFGAGSDARALVSSASKGKRRSSLHPAPQSGRYPRYN